MAEEPKKKNRTSYEAVAKYHKRVYAGLYVQLPKDLIYTFRERCDKLGVSRAQVVKKAIEAFLAETEEAESAAEAEAQ